MTITLGWWFVPTLITASAIAFALSPDDPPTGYMDIGHSVVAGFRIMIGVIASLAAWLAWALFA